MQHDYRPTIFTGDSRERMATFLVDKCVDCVVTSPPYWGLRDYGVAGQIGLESTPAEYVAKMVEVFREVRRVLRDEGTLWLNLGDTYCNGDKWGNGGANTGKQTRNPGGEVESWKAVRRKWAAAPGIKPKDLVGIPWRVAFALQADGWYLRSDIIWSKPNPMPESVIDRPTKAHEYLFLLSKNERYFYDHEAIREVAAQPPGIPRLTGQRKANANGFTTNGTGCSSLGSNQGRQLRNRRSAWTITPKPFKGAHFATFPPDLVEPCILAGCPAGGIVLDPFGGAGTTGMVAEQLRRRSVLVELNPEYVALARQRLDAARGVS